MVTSTDIFREVGIPTCSAQCSFAVIQASPLSSWTRSIGHASNEVIAGQPNCPSGMFLDAFRANVLLQLRMPSLDWTQKSTYYLILQACLEAGPPSSDNLVLRETHMDLFDDDFVSAMTAALAHSLGRFRANWQNDIAVSLLACLATRVLFLTTARPLVDALLGFLTEVRRVTLKWARQLLERIAGCQSEDEQTSLNQRVLMVALAFMSTFDIELGLLKPLLHFAPELSAFVGTGDGNTEICL